MKLTGATVHFVSDDYDQGPILLQDAVAGARRRHARQPGRPRPGRRAPSCVPEAIRLIAEGRVRIDDGRTRIATAANDGCGQIDPPFVARLLAWLVAWLVLDLA